MNSNEKQQVVYTPEGVRRQSPSRIQAVIFDFGGVVENNVMPLIYERTAELFDKDFDTAKSAVKIFWREFCTRQDIEKFWSMIAGELGDADKAGELEKMWMETYKNDAVVDKKIEAVIKSLKQQGIKIALISNMIKPMGEFNKQEKEIFQAFEPRVLSYENGCKKPEHEIYEIALRLLNMRAEECLFADDKIKNVLGAEEVGMHVIHFKNAEQLEEELKKLKIL